MHLSIDQLLPVVSAQERASSLARLGLQKALALMRGYGNQISSTHETALRELQSALAKQALGLTPGRFAYALPCGAGKTLSAVTFIAAAYELNLPLTFAISAAQILALGRLKRDLVGAGVPLDKIGLLHSQASKALIQMVSKAEDPDLLPYLESTGDAEFSIMLVCHARIRAGREFPAFCKFRGKPRDLLIWDETLITTDAEAVSWLDADSSMTRILPELDPCSVLAKTLEAIRALLGAEIAAQRAGSTPQGSLLLVGADIESARRELSGLSKHGQRFRLAALETLRALLRLAELPVAVALTGSGASGDGVIRYTIVVDPELRNIAVLDASYPIRLLAHEPSITDGTTEAMRTCKRYDYVSVVQHRVSAGKTTLLGDRKNVKALAARVAAHIRSLPESEAVLLFNHKGDKSRKLEPQMKDDLREEGIDLDARVTNGCKRVDRFNWLTWGNETSLSKMSHCHHVILCGVMRRSNLDVAACIAGQRKDLSFRLASDELNEVVVSEMAQCVLQAMSRGSCRKVDAEGFAHPMSLAVFSNEEGLFDRLALSLTGIKWRVVEEDAKPCRTSEAARAVFEYLSNLPQGEDEISVQALKKRLNISLGPDSMTAAIERALISSVLASIKGGPRWVRTPSGRSLMRITV